MPLAAKLPTPVQATVPLIVKLPTPVQATVPLIVKLPITVQATVPLVAKLPTPVQATVPLVAHPRNASLSRHFVATLGLLILPLSQFAPTPSLHFASLS